MKRLAFLLCIPALLLAGCATAQDPREGGFSGATRPNANMPRVFVVNDVFAVVDQDPVVLRPNNANEQGGKKARVTWVLEQDSKWRFRENDGIQVIPQPGTPKPTECRALGNGKRFQCVFEGRSPAPFVYKYILNLVNEDPKVPPIQQDPSVYANF